MLMPGVGRLERVAAGRDRQDQVDDEAKRDVVAVRAMLAAPAEVQPDLLGRDAAQGLSRPGGLWLAWGKLWGLGLV
jgi:hypothetical protein